MFNKSSFFLFIIVKLYIKFLIIQKLYERKGCLTRHPFHYVYKEFRLYFIPSNFILSKRNPIVLMYFANLPQRQFTRQYHLPKTRITEKSHFIYSPVIHLRTCMKRYRR